MFISILLNGQFVITVNTAYFILSIRNLFSDLLLFIQSYDYLFSYLLMKQKNVFGTFYYKYYCY